MRPSRVRRWRRRMSRALSRCCCRPSLTPRHKLSARSCRTPPTRARGARTQPSACSTTSTGRAQACSTIDEAILATTKIEPSALAVGEGQAGPQTRTLRIKNQAVESDHVRSVLRQRALDRRRDRAGFLSVRCDGRIQRAEHHGAGARYGIGRRDSHASHRAGEWTVRRLHRRHSSGRWCSLARAVRRIRGRLSGDSGDRVHTEQQLPARHKPGPGLLHGPGSGDG